MRISQWIFTLFALLTACIAIADAMTIPKACRRFLRDVHYALEGPEFNRRFRYAAKTNDIEYVAAVLQCPLVKNLDTSTLIDAQLVAAARGHYRVARMISDHSMYRSSRNVQRAWRRLVHFFKSVGKSIKNFFKGIF